MHKLLEMLALLLSGIAVLLFINFAPSSWLMNKLTEINQEVYKSAWRKEDKEYQDFSLHAINALIVTPSVVYLLHLFWRMIGLHSLLLIVPATAALTFVSYAWVGTILESSGNAMVGTSVALLGFWLLAPASQLQGSWLIYCSKLAASMFGAWAIYYVGCPIAYIIMRKFTYRACLKFREGLMEWHEYASEKVESASNTVFNSWQTTYFDRSNLQPIYLHLLSFALTGIVAKLFLDTSHALGLEGAWKFIVVPATIACFMLIGKYLLKWGNLSAAIVLAVMSDACLTRSAWLAGSDSFFSVCIGFMAATMTAGILLPVPYAFVHPFAAAFDTAPCLKLIGLPHACCWGAYRWLRQLIR